MEGVSAVLVNDCVLFHQRQDFGQSCRYGLKHTCGRSDSLEGKEDNVRYSARPRRTYEYTIHPMTLAKRLDLENTITEALAVKASAVPIWAKARFDFVRDETDRFVFDGSRDLPAVGSFWMLANGSEWTVVQIDSHDGLVVEWTQVEGGDGTHSGELSPILFGAIDPPSQSTGGDASTVKIKFTEREG